jgi:hypothetical protein
LAEGEERCGAVIAAAIILSALFFVGLGWCAGWYAGYSKGHDAGLAEGFIVGSGDGYISALKDFRRIVKEAETKHGVEGKIDVDFLLAQRRKAGQQ